MIFGKKRSKPEKTAGPVVVEQEPQKYSLKDDDVYVMPTKFVPVKAPAASPAKRGALILIILVLLLGGIVGGGIWFINKYQPKPPAVNTANTNVANIAVDTDNTNENTNANSNVNSNVNTNNNVNQDLDLNNNNNLNLNNNTNQTPVTVNLDVDGDGLTALEETLYKTNPQVSDTDKDGYSDGQEIANLYNPLVSNGKLVDSGLVTKYTNNDFSYELLYPTAWLVKSLNDTRSQVSLVPDTATGETININVLANTQHLELADWQKTLYVGQSLDNFSLAGRSALRTSDGLQVLLVTYDNVYTIIYDVPQQQERNYMTTFNMVLSSFKLLGNVK